MNRILTLTSVIAAVAMMSGCSKCSKEAPIQPPPVVEPTPDAAPTDVPEVAPVPTESAPTETK